MADDQIELPEVVVTPDEKPPELTAGQGGPASGYQDPQPLKDRLTAQAARNVSLDQVNDVKPDQPLPPNLRLDYANAMVTGETIGPDHFAELYHGAGHPPIEGLTRQLPDHQELDDYASALLTDAELPITSAFVKQTKANLLDAWADTGHELSDLYAQALHNPAVSDALTLPPAPVYADIEPVIQPKGVFDPLMHGAAAVANFFAPGGAGEPTGQITRLAKGLWDRAMEIGGSIPDALEQLPAIAQQRAEAEQGKSLEERTLDPAALKTAMDVALATGGALSVSGTLRGFFQTSEQATAQAEKSAAKEFVQGTVREQAGLARRQTAQAAAQLEEFRADINKALPEYREWLALDPAARLGQPVPMIQNLIDHIEGRSTGVQLDPKSPFAPVADALRDIYQGIRTTIENDYPDTLGSFYEDYYRHMWTNPHRADVMIGGGRMGSGASTQMRIIPTLSDGIAKGLTPQIVDPLENTVHYVSGMRNFIAQQEVLRLGRENGYVKYSMGGPPEDGWLQLKGRGAEKSFANEDGTVSTTRAYAHPGYAGSYNNWVGKGFYESPVGGKIYGALQYGANMLTGLKLSLSGYHAFNIVQESAVAGLADGIGDLAHGELVDAMKNILPSVTIGAQPVKQFLKGKALQEQYLGIKDYGPETERLADLYARSGGRATGAGTEFLGQDSIGFKSLNVWNPAKWGEDLQRIKNEIFTASRATDNAPVTDALLRTGKVGLAVGAQFGNLMSGLTKPMFENAIPKIKFSAWADEMSGWLGRNPNATEEATLAMGRKLSNSMDDRFGEMVQDNLFWPRTVKQLANLATISVGWEYGTLRAFGGAAGDILKGNLLSTRARWLYSFPITMALMSTAYQYAKTGTLPTQTDTPISDMIAPRTGGTVEYGKTLFPERAQLPGYQKDAEQWYFALRNAPDYTQIPPAVGQMAFNKLSPMWRLGYAGMTGNDPFTGNIIHSHPDLPGWKDYLNFVVKEMAPIGINTATDRRIGTNMSTPERLLGLRPTGENLAAPEKAQLGAQYRMMARQKAARGYEDYVKKHTEQPAQEMITLPDGTQAPADAPAVPKESPPRAPRSHHTKAKGGP